jgi:hypothetical protein
VFGHLFPLIRQSRLWAFRWPEVVSPVGNGNYDELPSAKSRFIILACNASSVGAERARQSAYEAAPLKELIAKHCRGSGNAADCHHERCMSARTRRLARAGAKRRHGPSIGRRPASTAKGRHAPGFKKKGTRRLSGGTHVSASGERHISPSREGQSPYGDLPDPSALPEAVLGLRERMANGTCPTRRLPPRHFRHA